MQDNGLLGIIKKKTFSNFQTTNDFQKAIKSKAINFVKAIIAKQKVSFFVGGQSGAGKTHICSAMLGEFAKHGICVYFFNYINDIATLNRYQYNSTEKDEYEKTINQITLKERVKHLDKVQKDIIFQRYYDGKTQMEIAEELNISQAQISRLEKRAIKQLKKTLQ